MEWQQPAPEAPVQATPPNPNEDRASAPPVPLVSVNRGGFNLGNHPADRLDERLRSGEFLPSDLAWHKGLTDWIPLRDLAPRFSTTEPTAPQLPPAHDPPPPQKTSSEGDRSSGPINGGDSLSKSLKKLRQHKFVLFGLAGLLAGALGSLLSEVVLLVGEFVRIQNPFLLILKVAAWTAVFSAPIAYGLFGANAFYIRRRFGWDSQLIALACGLIAGAISGAIAQGVYSFDFGHPLVKSILVRTFCWGLMGLLLALGLTTTIPNLKPRHASLGGFGGGIIGGGAFLVVGYLFGLVLNALLDSSAQTNQWLGFFVDACGRFLGIGLMGTALGLSIVVVESVFREAAVEVVWGPNENSFLNLGQDAVTIGGGPEDAVYIRGMDADYARIEFAEGQIEYVVCSTNQRTPLKDGSRLEIGQLSLVIHAQQ